MIAALLDGSLFDGVGLAGLGFGQPLGLVALIALPLLLIAERHRAQRRSAADARYGGSPSLRLGRDVASERARTALLLAAIVLLALAVARPRWARAPAPIEQRGIDVAIVLDVSRSMTATDIAPSRAAAAARGLRAMLAHMQGNRVGLVTFAGSAFERSPLTLDLGALATLVDRAQIEAPLVQPGTDLRLAIETALNLLTVDDAARTQAIVLVSDGEDLGTGIASALQRARDRHVPVYAVFAGTEADVALPPIASTLTSLRGAPATPPRAAPDVTRAARAPLETIARETGGQLRDLPATPGLAVEFRRLRQTQFATADRPAPIERFAWFLGGALALLLAHTLVPVARGAPPAPQPAPGSRRGAARGVAAATAALILVGCTGTAAYRQVQQGNLDYAAGRYDAALAAYRAAQRPDDPAVNYNIANALYRLQRFEGVAVAVAAALTVTRDADLTARLQFTAGDTAYERGELAQARAAFEAALRRDPTDGDAKANLELVLRRLEPPPQQQQQQQDGRATPPPGSPGQRPPQQPGPPQPGQGSPQPGQQPGPVGGTGTPATPDDVRAALEAALAELGPEVTAEEARGILALAAQANDLNQLLPRSGSGGVPPR